MSTLPYHVGFSIDPQVIHRLILKTSPVGDFLILAFRQLFHCMGKRDFAILSPGYLSLDNGISCIQYYYTHFIPPFTRCLHLYTSRVYIRKRGKKITLDRTDDLKCFLYVEYMFLGSASRSTIFVRF